MATNKKYDIVETSKMSMEYDGSLIDGTKVTSIALENGRLVQIVNDTIQYATTTGEVLLMANVESFSENYHGLTEFRTEQGEFGRVIRFRLGDVFKTTAIEGTIAKGDKVIVGTNGQLKKSATISGSENFVAEVLEVTTLGFSSGSLSIDRIPAIKVKVVKC